jgi:hypothetical protein
MATDERHPSAAARWEHVAAPIGPDEAAQALMITHEQAIGAFMVSSIAVHQS